jgi:hypothetical protein
VLCTRIPRAFIERPPSANKCDTSLLLLLLPPPPPPPAPPPVKEYPSSLLPATAALGRVNPVAAAPKDEEPHSLLPYGFDVPPVLLQDVLLLPTCATAALKETWLLLPPAPKTEEEGSEPPRGEGSGM